MKAVFLSIAVLALPVTATAQQAPASQYPVATSHQPVIQRSQIAVYADPLGQTESMRDRLRMARAGSPAERRERAARLAELVNAGECEAAQRAAVAERDNVMAERISQVCTASGNGA